MEFRRVLFRSAFLSASCEQRPLQAWDLNMQGLLNVLEVARETGCQVFWPSSIAVFGAHAPKTHCPQDTVTQPATVYGISKVAGENWCQYYHNTYGRSEEHKSEIQSQMRISYAVFRLKKK